MVECVAGLSPLSQGCGWSEPHKEHVGQREKQGENWTMVDQNTKNAFNNFQICEMNLPPYPTMSTNLQPWTVQRVTAFEGNLIMMNLEGAISILARSTWPRPTSRWRGRGWARWRRCGSSPWSWRGTTRRFPTQVSTETSHKIALGNWIEEKKGKWKVERRIPKNVLET